jgi:hypothetical protein
MGVDFGREDAVASELVESHAETTDTRKELYELEVWSVGCTILASVHL